MPAYRFVPQADHLVATSPSEQLNQELKDDLSRALDTGRPILTHLNADTTWLLSLAYPPASAPPPGRSRFNILFDPWLKGPQSDYYAWFSTQSHAIESSVQTIQELEVRRTDSITHVFAVWWMPLASLSFLGGFI